MFICLLCSLFGLITSFRIFLNSFSEFNFSEKRQAEIFKFLFFSFILLFFFASKKPSAVWLYSFFLSAGLKMAPPLARSVMERKLTEYYLEILDEMILNLRAGRSFRASLYNVTQSRNGFIKNYLLEIYHAVISNQSCFSKGSNKQLKRFILQLKEIETTQSNSIGQLSALRRNWKIQFDLNRKRNLSSQQADAQVAVLTFLQILLSLFVIFKFGFVENIQLISISYLLFTIGVLGSIWIKRGFKWKI